jgi:cytochrome oxidase Cu insertion factor (SCO1/SenC/PrrC family)
VGRVALAGLGLVLAAVGLHGQAAPERSASEIMDVLMWNREPVGGPFNLVDHGGRPRSDADFRGKLMLVYFGFTFCPDVCPTDLGQISRVLERLGPAGNDLQALFITVDPERDTPQHLASYVRQFHPRLIGLTGAAKAIRKAADAYKVYYKKVALSGRAGYTVDHTAFIYLMDRDGQYLGFFPPGTSADRMIEIIRPHLEAAATR